MEHITITGDGNIVGNKNVVISSIQKNVTNDKLLEYDNAFEPLRQEIKNLNTISEKVRNRAIRVIDDSKDESFDEKANAETIKSSLDMVKIVLEDAGEVYDSAKSWGKRLLELGQALAKYFPTIAGWINSL